MSGAGLGRAALHCYPVLKVVICRLHAFFLSWEEMMVEGGTKKMLVTINVAGLHHNSATILRLVLQ